MIKKAFTLIELLVVIVVISILASVIIVSYSGLNQRASVATIQTDLSNGRKQIINFQTQNGIFPTRNLCPVVSATDICIKSSGSYSLFVNANNSTNPQTFVLSTTSNNVTYSISENNNIISSSIVGSGLLLNLDANNPASYSGWNDLSGAANNSTLFASPTYVADRASYFNFSSGSAQYATAPNLGNLNNWTVETVVRFTAPYNTKVASVVGNQYNGLSSVNFSIGTNNAPINYNIAVGFFDGTWRNTNGVSYAQNSWWHITGTYDGSVVRQYTNGSQVDSLTYSGTPTSGGTVRINRRWDDFATSGNLFDSNISIVRIYNRALSASEVLQNFNATKDRYGL